MLGSGVMRLLLVLFTVLVAGCAAKQARVATVTPDGYETFGFSPAPGFFAERDVQYVEGKPHCIVRLTRAANPSGTPAYVEVVMDWCAGIE